MKTSLKLLDQMIEVAEADDRESKKNNLMKKASLTVGDSWMIFHLKLLREALQKENDQS